MRSGLAPSSVTWERLEALDAPAAFLAQTLATRYGYAAPQVKKDAATPNHPLPNSTTNRPFVITSTPGPLSRAMGVTAPLASVSHDSASGTTASPDLPGKKGTPPMITG